MYLFKGNVFFCVEDVVDEQNMMLLILFIFIGDFYSFRIYRIVFYKMIQLYIGDYDDYVYGGDFGERREIYVYLELLLNIFIIIYDNIMMLIVCFFNKKL